MITIELLQKILTNKPITMEELNNFIVDYVDLMLKETLSSQQLSIIIEMVKMGTFSLPYAAEQAAKKLNHQVTKLYDKHGILLNITVY
jgi:arsenate reductase-like glutaredoxin family protein